MENKYYVNTKYNKEMIESSIMFDGVRSDPAYQISRQVIQLQEDGVKAALYKLGYLNPDEVEEIKLDNLKLRKALSDLIGGLTSSDLHYGGGHCVDTVERAEEIISLFKGG